MKVVIIEDEGLTAQDLASTLYDLDHHIEIEAILKSVNEAKAFFEKRKDIDLIFSDIQLGDGLSLDIFQSMPFLIPVIFCTAYDEYALSAFKANGIDYLLKPFNTGMVREALQKYMSLKEGHHLKVDHLKGVFDAFEKQKRGQGAILVYHKDKILPISIDKIACFQIKDNQVCLITFESEIYQINKTLDELEKITGAAFFRASRQFLIHRRAVKNASSHLSRKATISLIVPVEGIITVSKEKMPHLLAWLTEN